MTTDNTAYQVRWAEVADGIQSGFWTSGTSSRGGVVTIMVTDADVTTAAITPLNTAEYIIQVRTTPGSVGDAEMVTVDLRNIPEDTDDLEYDVDGNNVVLSWDDAGDENITGWQYTTIAGQTRDPIPVTSVAITEKWIDMKGQR